MSTKENNYQDNAASIRKSNRLDDGFYGDGASVLGAESCAYKADASNAPEENLRSDSLRGGVDVNADTYDKSPMLETRQGMGTLTHGGRRTARDQWSVGFLLKNRYRVESVLGSGGFGIVYRAVDEAADNRVVAIKTLRHRLDDYETAARRFQREIEICQKLDNPHIVKIYDHGSTGEAECEQGAECDTLYYVMEFVEGKTLDHYIEMRERFSFYDVKRVMLQVLEGLSQAHQAQIVHRDLKPGNICLKQEEPDTHDFFVKLLDFGIAKALDDAGESVQKITQTGAWMGSPAYMSPEQLKGCSPTPASDIFSIGLIMIEMITGVQAINADSPMDAAMIILSNDAIIDEDWYWFMDTELWHVIEKCISKDPTLRYQNASECLAALNALDDNRLKNEYISSKMKKRARGGRSAALMSTASLQNTLTPEQVAIDKSRVRLQAFLIVMIVLVIVAIGVVYTVAYIKNEISRVPVETAELAPREKKMVRSTAFGAIFGTTPLYRFEITISSMPTGAGVYRESDGKLLGHTPLALSVIPNRGLWHLRLKADGYADYPFLVNTMLPSPNNLTMQPLAQEAGVAKNAVPGSNGELNSHESQKQIENVEQDANSDERIDAIAGNSEKAEETAKSAKKTDYKVDSPTKAESAAKSAKKTDYKVDSPANSKKKASAKKPSSKKEGSKNGWDIADIMGK